MEYEAVLNSIYNSRRTASRIVMDTLPPVNENRKGPCEEVFMNETIEANRSTRQLEGQINSLYIV